MVINAPKMHSLCISDLWSYIPRAFFRDTKGISFSSLDKIKVLGCTFSRHVEVIRKGFMARIWTLRHLGYWGLSKSYLLKVFKLIWLQIHDYYSCVYNSSLTHTQANALERLLPRP